MLIYYTKFLNDTSAGSDNLQNVLPGLQWNRDGYSTTGKPARVTFLEVARFENGKVKEDWLFYNGMAFASQLGLSSK